MTTNGQESRINITFTMTSAAVFEVIYKEPNKSPLL